MGVCASWKGNVDSLFSSAKNCLAALALSWIFMDGGRVEVNLETEGESTNFAKLLRKSRVIGMNWEIIFYMLMDVVLPCRCTVPLHFCRIVDTAIEASQSHM